MCHAMFVFAPGIEAAAGDSPMETPHGVEPAQKLTGVAVAAAPGREAEERPRLSMVVSRNTEDGGVR